MVAHPTSLPQLNQVTAAMKTHNLNLWQSPLWITAFVTPANIQTALSTVTLLIKIKMKPVLERQSWHQHKR
jgi:hypothetical protein